jgi:hypothetical protein
VTVRALAAACVLALGAPATAAPRNDAQAQRERLLAALAELNSHVHALRYAEARATAERALELGAARGEDLAAMARALGIITASLDDPATAEQWFLLWLSIDPTARLDPGTSPKVTAPFAAAKARATTPLDLALTSDRARYLITVRGDPGHFVRAVVVRAHDTRAHATTFEIDPYAPGATASPDGFVVSVESEPFPDVAVDVSLRDAHGNELLGASQRRPEPVMVGDGSGGGRPRPRSRSFFASPWPYAVIAGAAAGLGGVFVWRRAVATDDLDHILANSGQYTFADAEDARGRAERHGWSAVASFAAAGALATTAVILAVRSPEDRAVTVAPTTGGAMLLATTPF